MNLSNALMEACKLMEGVEKEEIIRYSEKVPLMDGIEVLTEKLHSSGVSLAMITTGFKTTMDIINERLGNPFKYIFCNELTFDSDGRATGAARFSVMENESKADRLREMAKKEGIALYQCASVGDGMGDVDMLAAAGLGIAFNPNSSLKDYAQKKHWVTVGKKDLKELMPYLFSNGKSTVYETV